MFECRSEFLHLQSAFLRTDASSRNCSWKSSLCEDHPEDWDPSLVSRVAVTLEQVVAVASSEYSVAEWRLILAAVLVEKHVRMHARTATLVASRHDGSALEGAVNSISRFPPNFLSELTRSAGTEWVRALAKAVLQLEPALQADVWPSFLVEMESDSDLNSFPRLVSFFHFLAIFQNTLVFGENDDENFLSLIRQLIVMVEADWLSHASTGIVFELLVTLIVCWKEAQLGTPPRSAASLFPLYWIHRDFLKQTQNDLLDLLGQVHGGGDQNLEFQFSFTTANNVIYQTEKMSKKLGKASRFISSKIDEDLAENPPDTMLTYSSTKDIHPMNKNHHWMVSRLLKTTLTRLCNSKFLVSLEEFFRASTPINFGLSETAFIREKEESLVQTVRSAINLIFLTELKTPDIEIFLLKFLKVISVAREEYLFAIKPTKTSIMELLISRSSPKHLRIACMRQVVKDSLWLSEYSEFFCVNCELFALEEGLMKELLATTAIADPAVAQHLKSIFITSFTASSIKQKVRFLFWLQSNVTLVNFLLPTNNEAITEFEQAATIMLNRLVDSSLLKEFQVSLNRILDLCLKDARRTAELLFRQILTSTEKSVAVLQIIDRIPFLVMSVENGESDKKGGVGHVFFDFLRDIFLSFNVSLTEKERFCFKHFIVETLTAFQPRFRHDPSRPFYSTAKRIIMDFLVAFLDPANPSASFSLELLVNLTRKGRAACKWLTLIAEPFDVIMRLLRIVDSSTLHFLPDVYLKTEATRLAASLALSLPTSDDSFAWLTSFILQSFSFSTAAAFIEASTAIEPKCRNAIEASKTLWTSLASPRGTEDWIHLFVAAASLHPSLGCSDKTVTGCLDEVSAITILATLIKTLDKNRCRGIVAFMLDAVEKNWIAPEVNEDSDSPLKFLREYDTQILRPWFIVGRMVTNAWRLLFTLEHAGIHIAAGKSSECSHLIVMNFVQLYSTLIDFINVRSLNEESGFHFSLFIILRIAEFTGRLAAKKLSGFNSADADRDPVFLFFLKLASGARSQVDMVSNRNRNKSGQICHDNKNDTGRLSGAPCSSRLFRKTILIAMRILPFVTQIEVLNRLLE